MAWADTGGLRLRSRKATDCQQTPEATRGNVGSRPTGFRGSTALLPLGFPISGIRRHDFLLF